MQDFQDERVRQRLDREVLLEAIGPGEGPPQRAHVGADGALVVEVEGRRVAGGNRLDLRFGEGGGFLEHKIPHIQHGCYDRTILNLRQQGANRFAPRFLALPEKKRDTLINKSTALPKAKQPWATP